MCATAADMKAALDRYRQELGTDYIDIMLLHGMRSPNWTTEMKPVMDVLSEAQGEGHHTQPRRIHPFARRDEVGRQDALVRGAPAGHQSCRREDGLDHLAEVVAVLRESKANGKGILGMKILGEGRLRDQINKTLSFVLGLDCLDAFTIGAANRDELSDLISRIKAV